MANFLRMSDPFSETPVATGHRRPEEHPEVKAQRLTVLLVEDEPQARESLVELLDSWGYRVLPVGSAEEAEHAVRSRRPDAAIVDLLLPGRSGAALVAKLRARFPDCVLIGVSGIDDPVIARQLKGIGADVFIAKPIDPGELGQALQEGHRSWH